MMNRRTFLRSAALGMAAGVGVLSQAHAAPALWQVAAPAALAAGTQATVATDVLNLRGGPGASEPLVGSLPGGQSVDLLGSSPDGAWWRVAAGDTVGYVAGSYLEPTGQASASGAFDLDLSFTYAAQQTAVWCDPADLEMWMGYRGQRPSAMSSYALQQSVWAWENANNDGYSVDQWDCTPFAVASAAHHWMPGSGFDHFRADDALASTRLLAWLLANPAFQEPSVALIWRGDHYVLVRGVRALGNPGQDPSGAQLLGLYVADPNRADTVWLGSDRYLSIDAWLSSYLTPVSYLTPHTGYPGDPWQDRFVTIQRSWTGGGPTGSGQVSATPDSYA